MAKLEAKFVLKIAKAGGYHADPAGVTVSEAAIIISCGHTCFASAAHLSQRKCTQTSGRSCTCSHSGLEDNPATSAP
jgi:hypothetical protein